MKNETFLYILEAIKGLFKVETAFHLLSVAIIAQAVVEKGDIRIAVAEAIALSSFGRVMPTELVDKKIRDTHKGSGD